MGKQMGSEKLGSFYTGKKARKRREWRGVRDTFYDYLQWLRIWGVLIGFAAKPNNVKAFFRYRWMVNYLVVPDFFDRHTEGMRGSQLRITHTALSIVVIDMCKAMTRMFRADPNIGNDEKLRKKMVLFDENMMSEIMRRRHTGFRRTSARCRLRSSALPSRTTIRESGRAQCTATRHATAV